MSQSIDLQAIPNTIPMLVSGKYSHLIQKGVKGPKTFIMEDRDPLDDYRFQVINGDTAIVPIHGIISHRYDWWYGGTDCQNLSAIIQKLLSIEQIRDIVFDIDSPGGEVGGVEQVANLIFENRDKKNFYAVANTLCASAAYWIAASCHKIYMAEKSSEVGSIGVILMHFSIEKALEEDGIKVTHIQTGSEKSLGTPYRDLTSEEEAKLSEEVHEVYTNFRASVSRGRGLSDQEIIDLEATTLMAKKAKSKKLADGHYTVAELARILANDEEKAMDDDEDKEAMDDDEDKNAMDEDEDKEAMDDDEDKEANDEEDDKEANDDEDSKKYSRKSMQNAVRLGIQMEQKRQKKIRSATIPGMESFMQKFVEDGKTSAAQAIMAQNQELIRMGGMGELASGHQGLPTARHDRNGQGSLSENNIGSYLSEDKKKVKKLGQLLAKK